MRVAVTGTPGTGKTTATSILEARLEESAGDADRQSSGDADRQSSDESAENDADRPSLEVIHLNAVLEEEGLYTEVDEERESKIADLDAIEGWLADRDDVLFESHLAHLFEADQVAVLRCRPERLEERLLERGESEAKATENAESEALDVLLAEAVDRHGREAVYEIDTTDHDPAAVADALEDVLTGEREPSAGEVDFVGYLA